MRTKDHIENWKYSGPWDRKLHEFVLATASKPSVLAPHPLSSWSVQCLPVPISSCDPSKSAGHNPSIAAGLPKLLATKRTCIASSLAPIGSTPIINPDSITASRSESDRDPVILSTAACAVQCAAPAHFLRLWYCRAFNSFLHLSCPLHLTSAPHSTIVLIIPMYTCRQLSAVLPQELLPMLLRLPSICLALSIYRHRYLLLFNRAAFHLPIETL